MKSEKGITLISLTVYIIAMAIVVGTLTIISTNFYKNMEEVNNATDTIAEYTRFTRYFADEVNHKGIEVLECGEINGQKYIVFSNKVQYTYILENRGIYRNNIKIAKNIDNCEFEEINQNGKQSVRVRISTDKFIKENTYTLKK